MKDSTKLMIVKTKLWFFTGSGFAGIFTSCATYLILGKTYSTTLAYYGIPPALAIIGLPVMFILASLGMGLFYKRSGLWEADTSYLNMQTNKEFATVCNKVNSTDEKVDAICKHLGIEV